MWINAVQFFRHERVDFINIFDFTTAHIEQAARIAKRNYEEERGFVPALPPIDKWPDLNPFAENNLGIAAFDGGEMVGFLCSYGVWENAWDTPGLRHIYSPMGANGTVPKNRAKIYARLYQAAGEKWARVGAASHVICLYAHDTESQAQFFRYGFGMRTVDAIRGMDKIVAPAYAGYDFSDLAEEDILEILPLENMLKYGFIESPTFMYKIPGDENEFLENYCNCKSIYSVARHDGKIIAFIKAEHDGQTFIQDNQGYIHINAAFCLPEHRGKGISKRLLNLLVQELKRQGYTCLGVDFESINPSAYGFWSKDFNAYTYGVVRRIDERVINNR